MAPYLQVLEPYFLYRGNLVYKRILQKCKWINICILKSRKFTKSHSQGKRPYTAFYFLLLDLHGVYSLRSFNCPLEAFFFLSTFIDHPKITNKIPECLKNWNFKKPVPHSSKVTSLKRCFLFGNMLLTQRKCLSLAFKALQAWNWGLFQILHWRQGGRVRKNKFYKLPVIK